MRERNINTRNTRKDERRDNFNKASILSSLHSMEFIHSLGIDLDGVVRWSFDVCCMVDKNHISTGLGTIIHLVFVFLYTVRLRSVVMMISIMGDIFIMRPVLIQVLRVHTNSE